MRDDHIDPDPDEYVLMDYEPELDFDEDEWRRGRCFNCGAWATEIAPGEFECECGDIWNIYEEPPDIP
jgi:hypothetical protein